MNFQNLLSQKVQSINESATLKMSALAASLKAQGKEIISLSLGEPDFDTPEYIKNAAKRALDEGYTKYTPVSGFIELRNAICQKLKRDNNLDFKPENIVVSNGAKQCISNLIIATMNPGDEGIIFSPYWVSYFDIINLAGGVPIAISSTIENDFKITPDQLRKAITHKTKFILFSSPCNPTGSVYTKEELKALAEVVADKEILIISDEIYEYINFTSAHFSIGSIPSVKDQTVTVNGFSKGFAMTGWRLGYMAGPKVIAEACTKIQGQDTSGANSIAQRAGIAALLEPKKPTEEMVAQFLKRKDITLSLLKKIDGFKVNNPTGAFYVFPDISELIGKKTNDGRSISDSDTFSEYILDEAGVAVVAGSAFGAENHIRISIASSEESLRQAIQKMSDAVDKLA